MTTNTVQSIAAWLQLKPSAIHSELDLSDELRFSLSWQERFVRYWLTDTLNALPYSVYRPLVDILKHLRGKTAVRRQINFAAGDYMRELQQIAVDHQRPLPPVRVCLTHDLDTAECAAFWSEVIRIEAKYDVRSTFNVLTKGPYKLERSLLYELQSEGFEIGLHGDTHDMAIGFRNPKQIRERLQRALDAIGLPVIGYRAPALGVSEILLQVLAELGFRYDSSIKANVYYTGGVDVCVPYLYPGANIWQLPLTLQDDGLFRDQNLDEADALQVIKDIVQVLQPYGGLFVFNSHPIHLRQHVLFYERVLDWFAESGVKVVLARELVQQLDDSL